MKTITDGWHLYRDSTATYGAPQEQLDDLKEAFFSGASVMGILMSEAGLAEFSGGETIELAELVSGLQRILAARKTLGDECVAYAAQRDRDMFQPDVGVH